MASNIEQNLAKILSSRYGKDVRQAIHDGIHDCYEDGKAGATDLIAREQIANLVSEDNPTEGNSELQDIRVGHDGATYTSAGEATQRSTVSLSEEIDNCISLPKYNAFMKKYEEQIGYFISWENSFDIFKDLERGGINNETGKPVTTQDYVRTKEFVMLDGEYHIDILSEDRLFICSYSIDEEFITAYSLKGVVSDTYTFHSDQKYKFVFYRNIDETFPEGYYDNIYSKYLFYVKSNNHKTIKNINLDSKDDFEIGGINSNTGEDVGTGIKGCVRSKSNLYYKLTMPVKVHTPYRIWFLEYDGAGVYKTHKYVKENQVFIPDKESYYRIVLLHSSDYYSPFNTSITEYLSLFSITDADCQPKRPPVPYSAATL